MALIDIDAVIAYVPGSMGKSCHYSIYLMKPKEAQRMWITRILLSRWFERER